MSQHDSSETIVRKVVGRYECLGQKFEALATSLSEFCLGWLNMVEYRLKYEDMMAALQSDEDDLVRFFRPMLGEMLEAMPQDTLGRIRAGAATAISATYSRAGPSAYDEFQPEDVYRVLRPDEAQALQDISIRLGY